MTPEEARAIWSEVKENQRRLAGCPGPHDFRDQPGQDVRTFPRMRCAVCLGEADIERVHWYRKGIEHASATSETAKGET